MVPPPRPNAKWHPAVQRHAREFECGLMDRREFLTRVTALGLSAPLAAGMTALPTRGLAQDAPRHGGTLRMQMTTKPIGDPRQFDWSEMANFTRGWLEYLVEYNADGSLRGMLLESWSATPDATGYDLFVRPGIRWSNGDAFTAADVARNIRRWCDTSVPGNSMATRMSALIDPATGQAGRDTIEIVDARTVRLRLKMPDITLVIGMADYPAAVVHDSYAGGDPSVDPVGTGPYLPAENQPGIRQVLVRDPDHDWWGRDVYGGPYLDRIEYIDFGTDPLATLAAARDGQIDATYQTTGAFVDAFDEIGWQASEVLTAATIVVRFHQDAPPFDRLNVRRAMTLAVDNGVLLELGYGDRGLVAENHHVCPIHPEYAIVPAPRPDPGRATAMMIEEGEADTAFELVSLDDDWQAATAAAVEAQLRDAGIDVRQRILPGAEFWRNWQSYPFSATEWNMRPLGVQVLALAYKSDAVWNETGFRNDRFDALLARAMQISDAEDRRAVMADIQALLQREGVMIQPFWRSLFRHAAGNVRGAQMHPTFEHHHYKWWLEA